MRVQPSKEPYGHAGGRRTGAFPLYNSLSMTPSRLWRKGCISRHTYNFPVGTQTRPLLKLCQNIIGWYSQRVFPKITHPWHFSAMFSSEDSQQQQRDTNSFACPQTAYQEKKGHWNSAKQPRCAASRFSDDIKGGWKKEAETSGNEQFAIVCLAIRCKSSGG